MTKRREKGALAIPAEALLEASADAILAVAPDGEILSWNAGAQRMFRFAADEAIGHSLVTLLHPADQAIEARRWL